MACQCCSEIGLNTPDIGNCVDKQCGKNVCGATERFHGENCNVCDDFLCYRHAHDHSFAKHSKNSGETFPQMMDYNINFMLNFLEKPSEYNLNDTISRANTLVKMFPSGDSISNLINIFLADLQTTSRNDWTASAGLQDQKEEWKELHDSLQVFKDDASRSGHDRQAS